MKLYTQAGRSLLQTRRRGAECSLYLHRCFSGDFNMENLHNITLPTHNNKIAFTIEGDDHADVCFVGIHGGPGSHKDFRHLSKPFQEVLIKKGFDSVYKDKEGLSHQFIKFDLPGYGGSDRMPGDPTAENYAQQIMDSLDQLKLRDDKKKNIVLIGHSLGGHIAASMSAKMGHSLRGLVLLSSVCLRPHKILGDDEYYWINKWLGENVENAVYGEALKSVLEFGYKNLANFPRSSKREEIAWTQQRVAALDWEGFEENIRSTKAPIFLSYAMDDHILQPERFRELAALINEHDNDQFQLSLNYVNEFKDGGHNIQKTKALELTKLIKSWLFYIQVVETSESLGLQLKKMKKHDSLSSIIKMKKVLKRGDTSDEQRKKRETGQYNAV